MHVEEWDFQLTVATLTPIACQELQILTLHDSYVARAYSSDQTPGDLFK
jgi:hypothetical protein